MTIEADNTYPNCSAITRAVEVGGLTKTELLQEFQKQSISMNDYGKRLFADDAWTPSVSSCRLETVELTTRQLGFHEGATSAQIFERAEQLGLSLCPLEVAPFLRLHYLDQPEGFWITVASRQLSEEPGFPNGFYLRRLADGLWLRGYTSTPDHVFDADDHFVFLQSRSERAQNADS